VRAGGNKVVEHMWAVRRYHFSLLSSIEIRTSIDWRDQLYEFCFPNRESSIESRKEPAVCSK
jgi:hypothetical protein